MNNDLQSLWQSMPTTPVAITVEEMRARAGKFERRIRRRNMIEYVAAAFVIVMFGWYATLPVAPAPLWPIANIAIILGTLVVVWNLHRVGRASATPASAEFGALLDFHRAELVRQRDALRTVWLWYLMPFVPGMTLWFAALWFATPDAQQTASWSMGLLTSAAVSVAIFVFIIALNLVGAARLQRLIDELDKLKE